MPAREVPHTDGHRFPWWMWLAGPLGLYNWLAQVRAGSTEGGFFLMIGRKPE